MLILQGVTYAHPNKDLLFSDINFVVAKQSKIALVGNNGTGKSTLLKILAGELLPVKGIVKADSPPYYLPQLFGQFNEKSIAQALGIEEKLHAFYNILNGDVTSENLALLNDDWTIEERCQEALAYWALSDINLLQKMKTLSGGQQTKVFLAGIALHQPQTVLLDEPSNHLDAESRSLLYNYIENTSNNLVVVSHDRKLLNLVDTVYELSQRGITAYGGNYDFYTEQKTLQNAALIHDLQSKEKELRKAKDIERDTLVRQQKLDARGKKKQEKAGLPTIIMNTFKNNAEKSTSKVKSIHSEKIDGISKKLLQLRDQVPNADKMKMGFDNSALHAGKTLITGKDINFGYEEKLLWARPINFQIKSSGRLVIKGSNGSGKTTLINIILGKLTPKYGSISGSNIKAVYIDQNYSLINNSLSVYQQAEQENSGHLQEHEIKIRLNRFLFSQEYWDKPCNVLSGGEKMRLMLCCLTINNIAPEIIILDEPTNNLDIQNVEILTNAVNEYQGALIVVSHDEYFLNQINIEDEIFFPSPQGLL